MSGEDIHVEEILFVDCQNGGVLDFPGMEWLTVRMVQSWIFQEWNCSMITFFFSGESFHSGSSGMGLGVKSEGWYKCQANCWGRNSEIQNQMDHQFCCPSNQNRIAAGSLS